MKNVVQVCGKRKSSIAVAIVKGPGNGLIRVNGSPLNQVKPEILKLKAFEPVFLAGDHLFKDLDIKIRVRGGGKISRIYAIRESIARGILKYYSEFVDENKKLELQQIFFNYDRSLLVGDKRQTEPKKAGGRGSRARYQKSYR